MLRLNVTLGRGSVEVHHGTVWGRLAITRLRRKLVKIRPLPPPKKKTNSPIVQFDPTHSHSPIQPPDGQ